jgi:branched-chain amino acid transport system permease protein
MENALEILKKNRTRLITLAILAFLFFTAVQGMETRDWAITVMRGLAVGAITFLVAAGLSLIFGLMDVLNLAHGEMFMIGAYVGWTVFVRPDTFVSVLTPVALVGIGFVLIPLWQVLVARLAPPQRVARIWPWVGLMAGAAVLIFTLGRYPISKWNPDVYAESPITFSLAASQGRAVVPDPVTFEAISPLLALLGLVVGGLILALAVVGLGRQTAVSNQAHIDRRPLYAAGGLLLLGLLVFWFSQPLIEFLYAISTTWRFALAMAVAALSGVLLGAVIEVTMIRPLYDRPLYQLMLTLGLSFIGIEMVRYIWGRPEFTMPRPEIFNGTGPNCPATSIGDLIAHQCATISFFDGRLRTYNEVFIILIGLIVLIGVWLLLQKTRLGMIIRAGVQDREMVEALGINVRQIFTLVFALGVGLAALGGVLAAPSIGLSSDMGTRLLLSALIAMAIGGLTSYPGAAAGAILVGLMQQFIIRYGQIGIALPFLAEPFRPSPPIVPASTILLMVVILLVLPNGLFGRNE